jgi:hypothetical protein
MIKDLVTLSDTVALMNSADYRDRFVAEYIQTAIRHEKLRAFVTRIESAEIWCTADKPEHDCPLAILHEQQGAMGRYLHLLEVRAVMEDIDLADAIAYIATKKAELNTLHKIEKARLATMECRMDYAEGGNE